MPRPQAFRLRITTMPDSIASRRNQPGWPPGTMKRCFQLWAAAVLIGSVGCSSSAPQQHGSGVPEFPILPPIEDAEPSKRQVVLVRVPTKLHIERTTETLAVEVDRSSLERTNLLIGAKMVTGVQSELYVYPEGNSRPSQSICLGLNGGVDFNLGTDYLNVKREGIPATGKKCVVEMDLEIFETDIPPQHEWSPFGGKYQVLWRRTLKQTVE